LKHLAMSSAAGLKSSQFNRKRNFGNVVSHDISKLLNPQIKPHRYLIRETERSDSILPHSTFPPGRRRLWPLRAGGRLPQSSNVVSHEGWSAHGSMQALPNSEIAALFRIFICPSRMQQFAKFPQKLKFRTSTRVVSYKIF